MPPPPAPVLCPLPVLSPQKLSLYYPCHLARDTRTSPPSVQEQAEPKSGKIKTRPAKATLLLKPYIRLGFSAFAGRDSHL